MVSEISVDPGRGALAPAIAATLRPSLTKKVGLLLFLFWTGAVVGVAIVYRVVDATRHDTHFVSVAKNQQMLAQQVILHAGMSMLGREEDRRALVDIVERFEAAQVALEKGGPVQGDVLPPATGEVLRALGETRRRWAEVRSHLRLEAGAPLGDPSPVEAILERELPHLSNAASEVVRTYQTSSDMRRELALTQVFAIAVFELVLLLVGLWLTRNFISMPVLAIEEAVDRMRKGDFSKPVKVETHDELEEMAEHLNAMGEQVNKVLVEEQAQLRDVEGNLRRLLDCAPVGIFELDPKGVVTRVVGRTVHAGGLQLGDHRGESVLESFDAAPWFPDQVRRALEGEAFVGGGDVGNRHVEVRFEPVCTDEGEVQGVVGVCTETSRQG